MKFFKCFDRDEKAFIGQVSTLGCVLDQPAHLRDECNLNEERWFRLTERGWVVCELPHAFIEIDMRDMRDRGTGAAV